MVCHVCVQKAPYNNSFEVSILILQDWIFCRTWSNFFFSHRKLFFLFCKIQILKVRKQIFSQFSWQTGLSFKKKSELVGRHEHNTFLIVAYWSKLLIIFSVSNFNNDQLVSLNLAIKQAKWTDNIYSINFLISLDSLLFLSKPRWQIKTNCLIWNSPIYVRLLHHTLPDEYFKFW